jgi:PAS domain S-box-containing protein
MEIRVEKRENGVLDRETLESIFEGMSEGIIFIGPDDRIVYMNRVAKEVAANLKRSNNRSLLGQPVFACHPQSSQHKILKIIGDVSRGKTDFHHRILKVGKNYYDSITSRAVSKDGNFLGIVLVVHDVTEKLKLQRKLEDSNKELQLLQEINYALNSTMNLDDILQLTVRGITDTFGYDYCAVHLLSEGDTSLICKNYSADYSVISRLERLTGLKATNYKIPLYKGNPLLEIVEARKSWLTSDIIELIKSHTDRELVRSMAPIIARIVRAKSAIGVPLCSGERVVGILGIGSKKTLGERDVQRLESFASQVGVAVEKARLYEEIKEKTHALQMVLKEIRGIPLFEPNEIPSEGVLKALSNPLRKNIAELLYSRGKTRFTDIKQILKIKDGTKLSFHLRELKSEGVVEQDEKKKYSLSPLGQRAIKILKGLDK